MKPTLIRLRSTALIIGIVVLVNACETTRQSPVVQTPLPPAAPTLDESVQRLIDLADSSIPALANNYLIQAMELLAEQQRFTEANELVERISLVGSFGNEQRIRLSTIQAEIAMDADDPQGALNYLDQQPPIDPGVQDIDLQARILTIRSQAYSVTGQFTEALQVQIRLNSLQSDPTQFNQNQIWNSVESLSNENLQLMADSADSYELRGWVELVRMMRSEQFSIKSQIDALSRWRTLWEQHSAASLPPESLLDLERIWAQRPMHIALLLPLKNQIGQAVQEGFLSAYYQTLDKDGDVPQISVFDTTGLTEIAGIYDTAVASGADLVIGPLAKDLVRQLNNMPALPVQTLALNYTDLTTRNSSNLFQFGLAPEDEIRQAAVLAWRQGYRNAAIISPASANYQNLQNQFSQSWQELGGDLVSTASFTGDNEYADLVKQLLSINDSEARANLITDLLPRNEIEFVPRRRADIDFIFLIANPRQGRQIKPTLEFYFAADIPVYAYSAIYDGSQNQLVNQDLNGIIFPDSPWILDQEDPLKQQVQESLRSVQGPLQRLRALGIDSFRLYTRLNQFNSGGINSFNGSTGRLSLTDYGSFQRIPETARFVDGLVSTYEPENN